MTNLQTQVLLGVEVFFSLVRSTYRDGHDFHFHRNDGERDGGFEIYMNFKQSGICQTDAPTLGIKCLSFSHETRITSERR